MTNRKTEKKIIVAIPKGRIFRKKNFLILIQEKSYSQVIKNLLISLRLEVLMWSIL